MTKRKALIKTLTGLIVVALACWGTGLLRWNTIIIRGKQGTYYLIIYFALLSLLLFVAETAIHPINIRKRILIGLGLGYLSGIAALIGTDFFMISGLERLMSIFRSVESFFVFLFIPVLLLSWLVGILMFIIINNLTNKKFMSIFIAIVFVFSGFRFSIAQLTQQKQSERLQQILDQQEVLNNKDTDM